MHSLDGITVVALEQAVAAPFATRQLADLGARVIKVERPGAGDFARDYDRAVHGQASYFVWLNRGKESIELDVKDPRGQRVLFALLGSADVFVQNLAPGAAQRLGLGAPDLRSRFPRLITCSVSGYGPDGPYRQKKAYDLLVQCEAGLLSVTGTPEQPAKAGISVADIAAGMYAYSGVLTALYERERTGAATSFDVAMLEALGEWMSQPFYYSVYGGQPARRTGARHASIAPYGPYRAGDGSQVFLGLQNEREWAVFCQQILRRPDLITDSRFGTNTDRVKHDDILTAIIESTLQPVSSDQLVTILDQAGIANARLRTPAEFAAHPQLSARDRWREVGTPAGPVRALLPPVTIAGREAVMGAIPALGQHTAAILDELRLSQNTDVGVPPRAVGPDPQVAHTGRAQRAEERPGTGIAERTEMITQEPAVALAGLLGVEGPDFAAGAGLPLLWHWIYLLERPPQAALGRDGHPLDGIPTPPGPGWRRMFAGGRVVQLGSLRPGTSATRRTWVGSTTEKLGRSGLLVSATVRSDISQNGEILIRETQDIVYREAASSVLRPSAPEPDNEPAPTHLWPVDVDPVLLFRFSALTYNSHRIHYDQEYARTVEGYPGLVVHGPLQALLMTELARRTGPPPIACDFAYRLESPLLEGQGLTVSATDSAGTSQLAVRDSTGRRTAVGTIGLVQ
jgi:itaconate CoA-transferase